MTLGKTHVHSNPRIKAQSSSSHDYENGASTSESWGEVMDVGCGKPGFKESLLKGSQRRQKG